VAATKGGCDVNEEVIPATGSVFSTQPIEHVREGMEVIDRDGKEIGKVEYIKMGDPQAATTAGSEHEAGGLVGKIAQTVFSDETEPDVPEPKRAQLVRYGFLKVDGAGLFGADRYVRADRIANVSDDRVILSVGKDELPRED
jgi:Uncharacterized protein conserved in bacteria (DUF2171)